MTIILASASPRRAQILQQLGLKCDISPSDIDESVMPGEAVDTYVRRMAEGKLRVAREEHPADAIIIAADTVVSIDGAILGKPRDAAQGLEVLASLSGRVHTVHTAVVVSQLDFTQTAMNVSEVTFRDITPQEAQHYWTTGEPQDKAGGYAIQGLGASFVKQLVGSYTGVVGLPVFELTQLLKQIDVSVFRVNQ